MPWCASISVHILKVKVLVGEWIFLLSIFSCFLGTFSHSSLVLSSKRCEGPCYGERDNHASVQAIVLQCPSPLSCWLHLYTRNQNIVLLLIQTLRGDKMSVLTHAYPHKPLRKIKWPFPVRGDKNGYVMQTRKKNMRKIKWPYAVTKLTVPFICGLMSDWWFVSMEKSMVICDTECPYNYWDQVPQNNIKFPTLIVPGNGRIPCTRAERKTSLSLLHPPVPHAAAVCPSSSFWWACLPLQHSSSPFL